MKGRNGVSEISSEEISVYHLLQLGIDPYWTRIDIRFVWLEPSI